MVIPTLPVKFVVPATARALEPSVAPLSANEVPVAAPRTGVVSVGEVENTRFVEVVPVVPEAVNPVILLKQVMLAAVQFVPPFATGSAVTQEETPLVVDVRTAPLAAGVATGSVKVHAVVDDAEDASVVGKAPALVLASVRVPAVVL